MPESTALGVRFARSLAEKDASRLRELLHPKIDFRGMTPSRNWEASDPQGVLDVLLDHWFEKDDVIEAIDVLDSASFADRERVGYRFSLSCPDGAFVVEQQAYLSERDGQIEWMRVLCSGFRSADSH